MKVSKEFLETFKDETLLKEKRISIDPVLKLVKSFFQTNNIVLYGGTAMNMYLPKKMQFYDKLDVPDYDGYSEKAEKMSVELIETLKKNKFEYLFVKRAIHDGTFKVSWEFKDVADITQLNTKEYTKVLQTSTTKGGLRIVDVNLLKSNAYVELCMPKSAMFRWSKVFERLELLEKAQPLKCNMNLNTLFTNEVIPDTVKHIKNVVEMYVKSNNYPRLGLSAVSHYTNNADVVNTDFFLTEILSETIYETVNNVKKLVRKFKDLEYTISPISDTQLVPNNIDITVYYENKPYKLISIYDATRSCYSVERNNKGNVFTSIFLLLHIYYYKLFMCTFKKETLKYKCIIIALLENIKKESFTTLCYGYNKSISAIMKSRSKKNIPVVLVKHVPKK
ncbi:hypothetical protein QKU58_gp082 [Pyramimonas orientalis virus]|uniref:Putative poly(A) polymerase catalytic subunit n=1 Tax=Pyramimonas orientalis virus 01B TaxID=3134525 RepID=A0A7L9AXG8_9VIRU|nr:hypothetical protein QKU58_gp082 [Pyramimonas orientalis virus]QOI90249.1 hypothetical protein HWQ62_00112 [Pyramimonas orientalis virus]